MQRHALLDSPSFKVDEATFNDVRASLAHTTSPYDFNAIPIHILGSIYERFLGKTITVTEKGARVEETVGELLKGKTPEDVRRMRFADIACGSGSFLLSVYDLLLRFHTTYYNATKTNRARGRKAGCVEHEDGSLHLSLLQRRDILLNNIYGVDVDPQAVEVAQLSLYLKLLEDENVATARKYQLEFREALLPSLNNNIICGNSLIARDIHEGRLFEREEEIKLNPMDFNNSFSRVMADGGFHAIVGNPPYVRIQGFPRKQIDYLSKNYRSAVGNFDLYVTMVERAYNLLKEGGRLGQILPNKFFKTDYGAGLRRFISENKALAKVVDFGADQVFDATTYTCLLFLSKGERSAFLYAQSQAKEEALSSAVFTTKGVDRFGADAWSFTDDRTARLLEKLAERSQPLLSLPADMSRGSSSGDDEVFMLSDSEAEVEEAILRTSVFASDFSRYAFRPAGEWRIIFPYVRDGDAYRLYTEQEMEKLFPKAYAYLLSHRDKLERRKQYKAWYAYSAPRNLTLHDRAQLLVPLLANRGLFAFVPEETRETLCLMASGGFSITLPERCPVSPKYLLGVLNSRLLFWKLRHLSNIFRGGWITCTKQYFGELPIRTIRFGDPAEEAQHEQMVQLVEQTLTAKQLSASASTDRDRNFYERKCADLERQIDNLVYTLYGLSNEEIAAVEANA